ncbi:MAG: hypothetical protein GC136_02465 [Alphaproteobacteria bacterium]|nr:hypothetical protein [Alphaproteobacteria bacterium]
MRRFIATAKPETLARVFQQAEAIKIENMLLDVIAPDAETVQKALGDGYEVSPAFGFLDAADEGKAPYFVLTRDARRFDDDEKTKLAQIFTDNNIPVEETGSRLFAVMAESQEHVEKLVGERYIVKPV